MALKLPFKRILSFNDSTRNWEKLKSYVDGLDVTDASFDSRLDTLEALSYSGYAQASAGLTLTNVIQDVPGASITVTQTGNYDCTGIFDVSSTTSGYAVVIGTLNANNVDQANNAILTLATGERATIAQQWRVNVTNTSFPIKLRGAKFLAAGAASFNSGNTNLSIRRVP